MMTDDLDVEAMLEAPFHKGQVIFFFSWIIIIAIICSIF